MPAWSDEQIEILKQAVAEGLDGPRIVARLDGVFTRNAVIGRIHRMGLPWTRKVTVVSTQAVAEKRFKQKVRPPTPIAPTDEVVVADGVPFMKLERWHCRSIVKERGEDGLAVYCGKQIDGSQSYCQHHSALYERVYVKKERSYDEGHKAVVRGRRIQGN